MNPHNPYGVKHLHTGAGGICDEQLRFYRTIDDALKAEGETISHYEHQHFSRGRPDECKGSRSTTLRRGHDKVVITLYSRGGE